MENKGNKSSSIIVILFLVLSLSLVIFLLFKYHESKSISEDEKQFILPSKMGTIYDRKGNILAIDTTIRSLEILDKDKMQEISSLLSSIYKIDAITLSEEMENNNSITIPANISDDTLSRLIKENGLKESLIISEKKERFYPLSYLKETLIKIEKAYSNLLRSSTSSDIESGDLVLTIDSNLDREINNELENIGYDGSFLLINKRGEIISYYSKDNYLEASRLVYSYTIDGITTVIYNSNIDYDNLIQKGSYSLLLSKDNHVALSLIEKILTNNLTL